MKNLNSSEFFEPTHAAAVARLNAITPTHYARSRNALDGAVTGLSPYLTHGIVSMAEAVRHVQARHPVSFDDKLVFEFGWREFFHHVWSRTAEGAILRDMHGEPTWPGRYADAVPPDIREGRTGVPAIDTAVRQLYATGYLHNHARMWLASYVVHVRKVHWRAGADWLIAHLLDGDLPSNHLSWQWVAGTFSNKPYLFNADNVLKFAPALAQSAWASSGTIIDQPYEALDTLARHQGDAGAEPGDYPAVQAPEVHSAPPTAVLEVLSASNQPHALAFSACAATDLIASLQPGQTLELVHPWALSPRQAHSTAKRLGVIHLPAHAAWPWSARRWAFVLQAMAREVDAVWVGDLTTLRSALNLPANTPVTAEATLFPGYHSALPRIAVLTPTRRLLPNPNMLCRSFSKFYTRVQRDAGTLHNLL